MSKKTVWVLTRSINDYNQDGEYFEAAFAQKPTLERLAKHFGGGGVAFLKHVRNGGGRREYENEWYDLSEVELG